MNNCTTNTLAHMIRDLRKRKKMTVRQLAAEIDRSIGFISQIERGLSQPTVEDLTAVADAFGVPTEIFAEPAKQPQLPWVTQPDERRILRYARGVTDYVVSPNLSGKLVMLETVLEPGADFGERSITEDTEQGGYVVEGEMTLWIADQEITIGAQSAFQIPSGVPCRYANRGSVVARIIWVYS
ncbi:helix-turn-helix domain-containing protein [Pseudomonas nitroreducens]|uniref:helix-turn-helix domain-containing protein n=1 Tax=Pseudomonas nitroreducens TaxID=46680 RepID=UPI0028AB9221|nr:XRE family transcriptional regulator [Pseudomonas nitroreducens]